MKRFDMIGDAGMKPIENGDWVAYDDAHLESIKSAIETVLEKKDELDASTPLEHRNYVWLLCAIEDLRAAFEDDK